MEIVEVSHAGETTKNGRSLGDGLEIQEKPVKNGSLGRYGLM